MTEFQYILFDLDGTLTDPGIGITNSVMYAFNKMGVQVSDRRELFRFIGPPLWESFEEFYGFTNEEADKAVVFYREYYQEKGIFECSLNDGMEELLIKLKESGKTLIVATSKPEFFAKPVISHFGIEKYFDFIAGSNLDRSRSIKAEVIGYALSSIGIKSAQNAVMIGDREHDVLGAKAFNIKTIGVLFGYGSREELEKAGADYIAENARDIEKIVL